MKRLYFCLMLTTFSLFKSQESIQTDRPDQTESPSITPARFLQIETGFLHEKYDWQTRNASHPTVLWKYGVNEHFELRLITELNTEEVEGQRISGIVPITFGFKASLTDEKVLVPKISFIGHLTSNTWGSREFHTTYLAPSFRFLFQHTLSDRLNLGYNLGAEWNGETPDATALYTVSTAYSFTEKFGGFLELYGYLSKNSGADHRFDAGLTYLLNRDLQFDVSSGFGISQSAPQYFFSGGISYRLKTH
ncbi:MAG: transporter [Weeksellaceae bacterium]|nr:transporter [Weeksellaceae bacterium]